MKRFMWKRVLCGMLVFGMLSSDVLVHAQSMKMAEDTVAVETPVLTLGTEQNGQILTEQEVMLYWYIINLQ